jgi:septal ring factor EnvC (AmiA/AmiB activator)
MSLYAQTKIKYGKGQGQSVIFEEGAKVSNSDFDRETLEALKESGALADTPPVRDAETAANDIKEAHNRIAELEAQLAASETDKAELSRRLSEVNDQLTAATATPGKTTVEAGDKPGATARAAGDVQPPAEKTTETVKAEEPKK